MSWSLSERVQCFSARGRGGGKQVPEASSCVTHTPLQTELSPGSERRGASPTVHAAPETPSEQPVSVQQK